MSIAEKNRGVWDVSHTQLRLEMSWWSQWQNVHWICWNQDFTRLPQQDCPGPVYIKGTFSPANDLERNLSQAHTENDAGELLHQVMHETPVYNSACTPLLKSLFWGQLSIYQKGKQKSPRTDFPAFSWQDTVFVPLGRNSKALFILISCAFSLLALYKHL